MEETLVKKSKNIVEEIHNSFDTAPVRIEANFNELLKSLNITTETEIETIAKRQLAIGFTKTVQIKDYERLAGINDRNVLIKSKTETNLKSFKYYQQKYPLNTILTIDELNNICQKYNLIYATVNNYIKDVPDSNLSEIENRKQLDENDYAVNVKTYYYSISKFSEGVDKNVKDILKKFTYTENFFDKDYREDFATREINKKIYEYLKVVHNIDYNNLIIDNIKEIKCSECKIDYTKLYIAAPTDHFNLENLAKTGHYSYNELKSIEPIVLRDPIVFEYLKNYFVRILSKWGLEANDTMLRNPIEN